MLHSGGSAALGDLEGGIEEAFLRGPEAVEFFGKKVDELWELEDDAPGDAGQELSGGTGGEGGGAEKQTRFYSRMAIVFWPRSRRYVAQHHARGKGRLGGGGLR